MLHQRKTNTTVATQVLIVEAHPLIQMGLIKLISDQPDMKVCGVAENVQAILNRIGEYRPDLLIIDVTPKSGQRIEMIKEILINEKNRALKILAISERSEILYAERVLRAGALGYVNKWEKVGEILKAVHQVLDGQVYLSPFFSNQLINHMIGMDEHSKPSLLALLSTRELDIFNFIGLGATVGEIATQLHLSTKTIESHRENIKHKLKLRSCNELIHQAVAWVLSQSYGEEMNRSAAAPPTRRLSVSAPPASASILSPAASSAGAG